MTKRCIVCHKEFIPKGSQLTCSEECSKLLKKRVKICPICGEKLKHFDNDSQGGRGYCCPSTKHRYYTWVSYKFIDKNFGKKNSEL